MICMHNIAHAVTARRPAEEPQRRPEGSSGEDGAIPRPMAEAQLLPQPREKHRVFPDDVAATNDGEPDLPVPPGPHPSA